MSYLTKENVLQTIKSRTIHIGGKDYSVFEAYLGTNPFSKKAVRMTCGSIEKLRKNISDFYKKLSAGGDFAVLLSPAESIDARKAIDILKENKHTASLVECVLQYINASKTKSVSKMTVGEAFEQYKEAQEGKSVYQVKAVESRVGRWVNSFGGERLLTEITADEVERELLSRFFTDRTEEQKTTYNNNLGYIKTFTRWCGPAGKSFLSEDPLGRLKPKVKAWRDKQYLPAEDCAKLFAYLERQEDKTNLADAVLSFMCGIRQEEIRRIRLGPKAVVINLDERFIRIIACKGSTKNVQPRVFTIPEQAYAWMTSFDFMKAVMNENPNFRKKLTRAARAAGISQLPENCGRHTFCTMFSAAYHDEMKLSSIAGNSEDVRAKHYNGLATEKEGKSFFAILPSATVSPRPLDSGHPKSDLSRSSDGER